jgi:plasmid stabilization system protein ParE
MRVRYTARARDDLEAILEFLAERSPAGAASVRRSIKKTIEVIAEFPEGGRLIGELGVRVLPTGRHPYLVYWAIRDGEVWLAHIRDARRQPWQE